MSIEVMTNVWKTSKHKGSWLLTLLAIADWADDAGKAFPSIETLRMKTRMSERSMQRIIQDLKSSGELDVEVQAGPGGVNIYQVNLEGGDKLAPPRRRRTKRVLPATPGGDASDGKGVTRATPRTVIEPSIEPSEEKTSKKKAPDYMVDLQAIPNPAHPFVKTEADMVAWMAGKGITPRKADETAAYIKGNWPGPRKSWKDPFAVFRTLVVKVWADSGRNGSRPSRATALPETAALEAGWGNNARTDSI